MQNTSAWFDQSVQERQIRAPYLGHQSISPESCQPSWFRDREMIMRLLGI